MRSREELLADCVGRLNATGIAYMLVGSMASNHWGTPRSTHDVDLVVYFTQEQVPVLLDAFSPDYFLQEASVWSAFHPPYFFNAIDQQSAFKIDFWYLTDKPFEREMFNRRMQIELLAQRTWMATPEDVLLHKLYWNAITPSDRQLLDAAGIYAVQKDRLDEPYLRKWATELGVMDTLEGILEGNIRPKTT